MEIAKLKAKADKIEAEAQVNHNEKMQSLERKHKETELKLKEIKEAGEESWDDIKIGYDKIRREMDQYIEDAVASSG